MRGAQKGDRRVLKGLAPREKANRTDFLIENVQYVGLP